MRSVVSRHWILGVALMLGGCDLGLGLGTECADFSRPAIMVILEDSTTGGSLASDSVVVTFRDGAYKYSHSLDAQANPSARGVSEDRAGVYDVTVSATGYMTWSTMDVRVRVDGCGRPETVSLLAKMQALQGV